MKELDPTTASFGELAAAARRLLAGLGPLQDADVGAPSLLPGWTRGHVLSHLARQAPALERLLEWARTGVETAQYTDRRARDTEIEAGARRPAAALVADVRETAAHFQRAVEELPAPAWDVTIRPFTGELCTPRRVLVIRLRELELHHVDLAIGYGFRDIPATARDIVLDDVLGYYAEADGVPEFTLRDDTGAELARFGTGGPVVTGDRAGLLAWLAGRASGDALETTGRLPALPPWI
ncbi:maleylpyruvate isomerase family mycothiol-dependent enzyme [Streptomyces tirandamycinicus]|uniref:maleylpyruvate isomerase family mycothiol-dependent enzyme n=1 Tax=Streptomyces tirandamycinicus TaxID=2174846 RepID=UPI00226F1820|nr:maleylpyruvate isomerase family mycothiol-dependent enzyme [Streptomyces tirandamycinicus]MCY0982115.1 maleylpyruvate isomerase family mycothiol-dependent enzyme [Streptomyces tirandamycinicus]